MRWIEGDAEFAQILLRARTCIYIDSGREARSLKRLNFDDAQICTDEFANLLQTLIKRSGDQAAHYVVLEPDPVHYFHQRFNRYPVLEIALGDPTRSEEHT